MHKIFVTIFLVSLIGCEVPSDAEENKVNDEAAKSNVIGDIKKDGVMKNSGLHQIHSNTDFEATYSRLTDKLKENESITVMAEVDHSKIAEQVDIVLDPTRLVLFGNPKLGTPLMQKNQQVGLDLPQKFVVYEIDSQVIVIHNDPMYIKSRHGLDSMEVLDKMQSGLSKLSEVASGLLINSESTDVPISEGIVQISGKYDINTTYQKLKKVLEGNEKFTIMAEVDHAANAKSAGMELRPTRLIVFGNPMVGTPLIGKQQSLAIDLPQKMLVYEDEQGITQLIYNDAAFLMRRHGIDDADVEKVNEALSDLAKAATE